MDGHLRAEISASALQHNIAQVRGCLAPGVKLCPVVKANAYGHGIEQVVGVLRESADMLGVAICSEAVGLRRLRWHRPILQLATAGGLDSDDLAQLIAVGVTLTLTTTDEVKLLGEAAGKAHRPAQVHVKIDSGMSRGGAPIESAPAVAAAARQAQFIQLAGIYTHLASADEPDKEPTQWQLQRFLEAVDRCGGGDGLLLHAANSAGVMDLPETHLDMVRPGIALYGLPPAATIRRKLDLRPALRLTAPMVLIKDVPAGARTGYGLTYRFERPGRLAL
ncbi:MAG: alanine racemase, partial [Planctomycetota bacterium]